MYKAQRESVRRREERERAEVRANATVYGVIIGLATALTIGSAIYVF